MKFCRFDGNRYGVLLGDHVADITAVADSMVRSAAVERFCDPFISRLDRIRAALPKDLSRVPTVPRESVSMLSPVAAPGKVVAAPVNFRAHVREMQESTIGKGFNFLDIGDAGLFLKAASSVVGPSEGIALRFPDRRTDYEVELVVVIGMRADRVPRTEARQYIAGYCLGIDITLRGTEDRSFRKSIDTYSVIGPWLTTADEDIDPNGLRLSLRQNGELKQDALTSEMVYDVERLIEFASSFYTLYPGDIIFTGTPQGVGPIKVGDELTAACPQLGEMTVKVHSAD